MPGHRIGLRFRVLLFFDRFLRNNIFTQFTVGREHPMKPCQIDPWSGYQRRQPSHEFHWAEHDMSGAIIVRRLQRDDDVAVVG